jgi:chemotaxis regulatin CheY-phosphate phosphatase CheZ
MLLAFMARWMEEWMNSPVKLSQFRTLCTCQCFLRQVLRVQSMRIIVKLGEFNWQ